jgi:hypothetical protein
MFKLNKMFSIGAISSFSVYNPLISYDWSTKNTKSDYIISDKELVDNGNFNSSDFTGWTFNYVSASVQNGVLLLTGTGSVPVNQVLWTKPINLTIGRRYRLVSTLISLSSTTGWNLSGLKFVDTGLGYKYITTTGTYEFIVEATGSVGKIGHHCSTAPGNTASFDDTSLKEIISEPNMRYLTDKGKSPKYNTQLYFGQGVSFNGIDQGVKDIPYTLTEQKLTIILNAVTISNTTNQYLLACQSNPIIWRTGSLLRVYINGVNHDVCNIGSLVNIGIITIIVDNGVLKFYLNNVLKYTGNCGLVATSGITRIAYDGYGAAYASSVIKDIFMFSRVLTQTEITQSYEQPESFYNMAQTDNTCVLNITMCENDSYVRNMKTYNEGGNFNDVTLGSQTVGTGNSITQNNNIFSITNVTSTTQVYYPLVRFYPNVFNSDLYYQEIEVKCITGTLKVGSIEGSPTTNVNEVLTAGQSRVYTKISGFVNQGGAKGVIFLDGLNYPTFTAEVTLKNIRKLTGIYPIQNYTAACRTNAQQLSHGLQTCKFNRDSLGIIKGVSQFLECKGIGYADTGWVPPTNKDFTIECIIELIPNYTHQQNGSGNLSNAKIHFGLWNDNKPYIQGRSPSTFYKQAITVKTIMCFTVVKEGSVNKLFIDNELISTEVDSQITESMSFTLGKRMSYISASPIRLFKVHDKALTQLELTKNYQSYQQKGLLT